MRTITTTINIYTFNELSEEAKDKAFEYWISSAEYPYKKENQKVLTHFCNLFNVLVKDWEVDEMFYSFRHITLVDDEIECLSGERLLKYLQNNFYYELYTPKEYILNGKKRTSKLFWFAYYQPTGYYLDRDIIRPIYNFIKKPDKETNYNDLMRKCLDAFFEGCRRDYKDFYSIESFESICEANEYEFLEDGTRV